MLLPMKVARGVADGSMDLAFRRWKRQDVQPGRTFKTVAGVVRVDEVTEVDPDAITDEDKIDVRNLKNLGLTRSYDVGYDLSPRGEEYLRRTGRA